MWLKVNSVRVDELDEQCRVGANTGRPNHVNLHLAHVMYPHHSVSLALGANMGTPWKVTICSTLHSISATLDALLAAEWKLLRLERVLINSFMCSPRQKGFCETMIGTSMPCSQSYFFISEGEAKKRAKEHNTPKLLLEMTRFNLCSIRFGPGAEIPRQL